MAQKIDLEFIFDSFRIGFLQDMVTSLTALIQNDPNLKIIDIIEFGNKRFAQLRSLEYEEAKKQEMRSREFISKVKRCPECGTRMSLFRVNHTDCAMVGGEYNSAWQCLDVMGCGEVIFSSLTLEKEAELHGLKEFYDKKEAEPYHPPKNPDRRKKKAGAAYAQNRQRPEPEYKSRPCGGCNK